MPIFIVAVILIIFGAGLVQIPHDKFRSDKTYPLLDLTEFPQKKDNSLKLGFLKMADPGKEVQEVCKNSKLAVNLLVDSSGSMEGEKIDKTKAIIEELGSKLPGDTLIGLQSLDKVVIKFNKLKDLKKDLKTLLKKLKPKGGSPVLTGFELARGEISQAKKDFPSYSNFVLIFLSDGGPSPMPKEDPRPTARALKSQFPDLKIVNIGLGFKNLAGSGLNNLPFGKKAGETGGEEAKKILVDMATSPGDYYEPDLDQLSQTYQTILLQSCGIKSTQSPAPGF